MLNILLVKAYKLSLYTNFIHGIAIHGMALHGIAIHAIAIVLCILFLEFKDTKEASFTRQKPLIITGFASFVFPKTFASSYIYCLISGSRSIYF